MIRALALAGALAIGQAAPDPHLPRPSYDKAMPALPDLSVIVVVMGRFSILRVSKIL